MTDPYAHGTPAGDYHTWIDPGAETACAGCSCCTARLCEAGRERLGGCGNATELADRDRVWHCPCGRASGSVEDVLAQMRRILLALPKDRQAAASVLAQAAARRAGEGVADRIIAEAMLAEAMLAAERYKRLDDDQGAGRS